MRDRNKNDTKHNNRMPMNGGFWCMLFVFVLWVIGKWKGRLDTDTQCVGVGN